MGRLRTPGPGAYESPAYMSIGGRLGSRPTASFASNSKRTDRSRSASSEHAFYTVDKPGVHSGKAEDLSSRSKRSFNRVVSAGKSSFSSTSHRSSSVPPRSARGGPGSYDSSHLYSCGLHSTQMTSSFLSAQPLGGHVRKSITPGVGEYDIDPDALATTSTKKNGPGSFSNAVKPSRPPTTSENVGPGSYELSGDSIENRMIRKSNPRQPGFGSSSVRTGPEDA